MKQVLIAATELAQALEKDGAPQVFDCRARLGDLDAGRRLWEAGHVPGSLHLDLDRDLAAEPGAGGRHPLPSADDFAATLRRLGVTPQRPVVVLDDMGGQLAAARAWWMLAIWAGHPDVRVLDGGLKAWQEAGGELVLGQEPLPEPSQWQPAFDDGARIAADEVFSGRELKVDARSEERFRGEAEPIDPVAGHIPGAVCRPSATNLADTGRFKAPEALEAELPRAEAIVAYCGSGVTACHNILAYAIAGRTLPRLYAGSWSEWVRDPSRPVARSGRGNA
ncbi:sulfurtransferase [Billgrantia aerodenitrificans]|jgi:thiosulfate/3-mercaptopyruvate sulfurtransferase|uniref:Sulfurtransferase n=1 Tax=Billgrantia aerodenitrificans TaxID=2733483 RepID=A0ABS9ASQ3_9GAMM|nr:sulfurtransferase [Halomonas aerodenitrificans]MCE8024911.1 sulfurtransferase [Halomonas aerodenitrificans]